MSASHSTTAPKPPIIVVGAGMAGLTCAAALHAAGREVIVLDAANAVGGRLRTDRHPDGFLLDRGFQVILEAYPALKRWVDLEPLRPAAFDAGAQVWTGRRLVPLADPFRHPAALLRDLTVPLIPWRDKGRLALVAAGARLAAWPCAAAAAGPPGKDRAAVDDLAAAGFGPDFIDRFARPFWGGILLDRSLATSSGPLRFTLKMFLAGNALLPASGVQAVPERLARRLPLGVVRLKQRVEAVVQEDGRVTGVRVGGQTLPASAVVVATDPPAAKHLTGIAAIPDQGLGCVTVYLRGQRDPGTGLRLVLDSTGTRTVNHLAPLSVVQPRYAPPGQHLLAAVIIGEAATADDDALAARAQDDVATMLGQPADEWIPFAVVRVPFSQFAQPPGIYGRLPDPVTATRGLYLAGEATVDSSVNGAIISGEAAARAILRRVRSHKSGVI